MWPSNGATHDNGKSAGFHGLAREVGRIDAAFGDDRDADCSHQLFDETRIKVRDMGRVGRVAAHGGENKIGARLECLHGFLNCGDIRHNRKLQLGFNAPEPFECA